MKTLSALLLQLLKRDLSVLSKEYASTLFNTGLLFFTNVVVFSYFMGKQGLSQKYGPFLMIGAISSFWLFQVINKVSKFIGDIEGDKTICFLVILPLSSTALFCYMAVYWALHSALFSFPLFIFGKILLFTRFDLTAVSYWRLLLIYLSSNLFYGFFALWLSGVIKGLGDLSTIFLRYINPIFMFGAYFYSWKDVFALDHLIGYLLLLNPMVYIMEGMRSAALGPTPYLPFWICPLVLWSFIFLLGKNGIRRLKRRIDCL